MYALLLLVGFLGFVAMAGAGFLHSGHGHRAAGGDCHHNFTSVKPLHQHASSGAHHPVKAFKGKSGYSWWVITPLDLFAMSLGAGAAGTLLQKTLEPGPLVAAAVSGAALFNFGIVKPLMSALLKFASRESHGLEGSVAHPAEAATRFDDHGRGLVRLSLDGQIVQLLATLESEEQARGVQVAKGDSVTIVEVDASRNTCRVTRELYS